MMRRVLWFVTATLWLSVPDVQGQAFPDLKVSVFGGGSFSSMSRTFTIDDSDDFFTTEFMSGPRLGIRASTPVTGRLLLEGSYTYGKNDLRVTEFGPPTQTRHFGMTNHQFAGNALFYLDTSRDWKPFVTSGLGITRYAPTGEAVILANVRFLDNSTPLLAENKWSLNLGGGAEKALSESLFFRVDLRDNITQVPRFGIRRTSDGSGSGFYPVQGWGHSIELSGSLAFAFSLR